MRSAVPCILGLALLTAAAPGQQQAAALRPGQLPINAEGSVLTRVEDTGRRWRFRYQLTLIGVQPRARDVRDIVETRSVRLDGMRFVFPQIGATASSIPYPEETMGFVENEDRRRTSDAFLSRFDANTLSKEERIIARDFRTIEGYQGPTSLLVWDVDRRIDARSVLIDLVFETRSWETRIDERRADAIEWPDAAWPPTLASALEPQLFVNPDHPSIQRLLELWLDGNDPRDARPYALAKMLAGRVVEHVQFTDGDFHSVGRTFLVGEPQRVFVNGYRVNGSVFAAEAERGLSSRFDAPALLCAIYRAAGLPARLVIGFDEERTNDQPQENSERPLLRSWVEFALYDDRRGVTEWIPVDVTRQRDFSDRAPPLDQRWQFFGHNEELDFVVPISHHWHPPTTVTNAGPPAVWGYLPEPEIPNIDTKLEMWAFEAPTRATDPVDPYRRP